MLNDVSIINKTIRFDELKRKYSMRLVVIDWKNEDDIHDNHDHDGYHILLISSIRSTVL